MSDALIEELIAMWSRVAGRSSCGLATGKISVQLAGRPVTAAVDAAGSRHLLIPVETAPDLRGLWRCASISASRRNLRGEDRVTRCWLDLHCRRPELELVFAKLAVAVTESLRRVSAELLEGSCIAVLDEWRDLFGRGRPAEESITGILGELLVLERLASEDPTRALAAWVGPEGGRHDFRLGSHAIEVKTTTTRVGTFVQIHGLWQMLEPEGGELHLALVRLEKVPGGRVSIASLMQRLNELGVPPGDLAENLEDAGFGELNSEASTMTYEIRAREWFRVDADFPRIVPSSFGGGGLPPGVTDISYGIDLLGRQAIPDAEAGPIVGRFFSESE